MRRYTLEVNGKTFTLDVDELAADRFVVTAGGQTFEVRLSGDEDLPGATIAPGIVPGEATGMGSALRPPPHAARSAPPAIANGAAAHGPSTDSVPERARHGQPQSASAPAPAPPRSDAGPQPGAGRTVLTAPMPGVVLEVQVEPRMPVRRGQPLLILEAMKMRNAICAPRDGVVAEVHVRAGQQVRHGEPLVRFEAAEA